MEDHELQLDRDTRFPRFVYHPQGRSRVRLNYAIAHLLFHAVGEVTARPAVTPYHHWLLGSSLGWGEETVCSCAFSRRWRSHGAPGGHALPSLAFGQWLGLG